MCEHCKKSGVLSVEPYDAEDDELCEFMDEPESLEDIEDAALLCEQKASYLIVETTVDDHLCGRHAGEAIEEEADADMFAESIGLGSSTTVQIEEEYTGICEYFDPLNPQPKKCSERATHARILEFEFLYCEEHFKEEYEGEIQ